MLNEGQSHPVDQFPPERSGVFKWGEQINDPCYTRMSLHSVYIYCFPHGLS